MMHDLKNSVAQLKLIVSNAARHKSNPAFVEDAIDTIANAVERMTRLIEQLRGTPDVSRNTRLDLSAIVQEAVGRTRDRSPEPQLSLDGSTFEVTADGERLASVLEHVIRNAQDSVGGGGNGEVSVTLERRAAEAEIAIADTGAGMDARFVRERLFRPFDSTKGSKGMGIGAYQAREYVRQLGGDVEVQSSPGRGTRFLIRLPLAAEQRILQTESASLSR
jgi:putative PEP-CTERM system histidine kinase